jgi:DNA repair protein RecN (Recombination protein N)
MLRRLRIENLAVVEDVTLELGPGLNVLTGSTGAGKSLVVGAVNLLFGERAGADIIRQDCDEARVSAEFDPPSSATAAELTALVTPDQPVVIVRRVGQNGRSSASVNGRAVPLKDLRAVCAHLIEPHGQNVQYQLRDPSRHVEYVDAFAGNAGRRARYATALAELRGAHAALTRHDAEAAALAEKRELYTHRIAEIERVAPRPGEKHELETRARVYANAEKLYGAVQAACGALYDDDESAAARIGESERRLTPLAPIDPRIAASLQQLAQAAVLLDEAVETARGILDDLDFDPADVERVQERLDALVRLERRYQASADELVAQADGWRELLDDLDGSGDRRRQLERAVETAARAVEREGLALRDARTRSATDLDARVSRAVQSLSMPGAEFRTDFAVQVDASSPVTVDGQAVACHEDGLDVVRMRIRTNPGEAEGPLEAIASTGELSRVALVLKQLAAADRSGATLIFDEIDAGVGADLGDALAENLLALAKVHQIICITHMPQIAARGHSHLVVRKDIEGDRTRVRVSAVAGDDRTREVARMLGGMQGSDRRAALAAELLEPARGDRKKKHVRP